MTSLSPSVADAHALLESRLADAGLRLEQSIAEYRPAEPTTLRAAPRAVFRIGLADPSSGWLLIYDLGSADAAERAGRQFAAYLSGGQGRTNYPLDAQFTLNQLDTSLVFSWASRSRSADPEQAQAALDVIAPLGRSFEIRR